MNDASCRLAHFVRNRGLRHRIRRSDDCGIHEALAMNVTLKTRIGPVTDLRTKRLLETTASLMSAIGQHHRDRIMTKAKRWK